MDTMTSGGEKEIHLGAVARTLSEMPDLFTAAAENISHSNRLRRFPTGPVLALRDSAGFADEERDAERWDGLY